MNSSARGARGERPAHKIHNTRESILVIRRDNIGDLVLTTPLIRVLRTARPSAWIAALVNTYNAPVLDGNPDLDAVYAYDKAKHQPDRHRFAVFADTAKLLFTLRRQQIDHVILAGPGAQRRAYALARWIKPRGITGFVTADFAPAGITVPVAYGDGTQLHEAQDVLRLLAPCGVPVSDPPCRVYADAAGVAVWRTRIAQAMAGEIENSVADGVANSAAASAVASIAESTVGSAPLIAIHISARRVKQRWPAAHFASTMQRLQQRHGARFLLLWSPGAVDEARHPGDDARAREVIAALPPAFPVAACPTHALSDLIAVLSLVDAVICADGGAMHLAAGLGKPLVALFGDSPVARWRPWGVVHEIVQAPEGDVAEIKVSDVVSAYERLVPKVLAG